MAKALIFFICIVWSSSWAQADLLPSSYSCSSDPVSVNGEIISLSVDLELGFLNSFRRLSYGYTTKSGSINLESNVDFPCMSHKNGDIRCFPGDLDPMVKEIFLHHVLGLGFIAVDNPVAHFLQCNNRI